MPEVHYSEFLGQLQPIIMFLCLTIACLWPQNTEWWTTSVCWLMYITALDFRKALWRFARTHLLDMHVQVQDHICLFQVRGHRKSSQKPSETNKGNFTWNPSLPQIGQKFKSHFRLQLSDQWVYKTPFEAKSAIFSKKKKKPTLPNEYGSFHWASVNSCDGP